LFGLPTWQRKPSVRVEFGDVLLQLADGGPGELVQTMVVYNHRLDTLGLVTAL